MFGCFVGLIKEVAKLDKIIMELDEDKNAGVDLVIHPGEDYINFWLAKNTDRDGADYECEVLAHPNEDMAFVYECSIDDQEDLEVTLHNAFVDVEEYIAYLQEKQNGKA